MKNSKTVIIFLCKKTGALDFLLANLLSSSFKGELIVKTYVRDMYLDLKNNSKFLYELIEKKFNIKITIELVKITKYERYISFIYYKLGLFLPSFYSGILLL